MPIGAVHAYRLHAAYATYCLYKRLTTWAAHTAQAYAAHIAHMYT